MRKSTTVKEMKKFLENLDDDMLIVTSSSTYAWECYEDIKEPEIRALYINGGIYDSEKYGEEQQTEVKVVVV